MKKYYMNEQTGEITESHVEAVAWYRVHISVSIWTYDNAAGEYVKRLTWTH